VDRLLLKTPVRLGPMANEIVEGENIRRRSRDIFSQRVVDNAFHPSKMPQGPQTPLTDADAALDEPLAVDSAGVWE
jgi:hypothetical protein